MSSITLSLRVTAKAWEGRLASLPVETSSCSPLSGTLSEFILEDITSLCRPWGGKCRGVECCVDQCRSRAEAWRWIVRFRRLKMKRGSRRTVAEEVRIRQCGIVKKEIVRNVVTLSSNKVI